MRIKPFERPHFSLIVTNCTGVAKHAVSWWHLYEEMKITSCDILIAVILWFEEMRDKEIFQLSAKYTYPTAPSEAEFLALFSCRCGSSCWSSPPPLTISKMEGGGWISWPDACMETSPCQFKGLLSYSANMRAFWPLLVIQTAFYKAYNTNG